MIIKIDKKKCIPLSRQIYSAIKDFILSGTVSSGEKLPSSRTLSKHLGVSRNTVLEAYNQLIAEGYLEGKHGSGTLVAKGITKHNRPAYIRQLKEISAPFNTKEETIDFRSGVPDFSLFPQKEWVNLYKKICGNLPKTVFRYCNFGGVWELRESISQYLFRTRGIECHPKNIMIISGATQGLALLSRLLFKKYKKALVEEPVHPSILKIITSEGISVEGIEADDKGINTSLLKTNSDASFIYTTPSHQYPLGSVLPIQRRLSLIQFVSEKDCYVIESDYGNGSTFRFEGAPISSLYELNPEKVIYLSSFSKILSPALRLAFMILPDTLIKEYEYLKMNADVHSEVLSQYVLAEYINSGQLEKHTAKINKIYNQKRKNLISELHNHLPGEFEIKGQTAGLHVLACFHNIIFNSELINRIASSGVTVYPVENFTFQNHGRHRNEIIMGYAHLSPLEITLGVKIMSHIINDYCNPK
ncbi:PLP-dependent aminotransferase family protein [Candidatus Woesearchaeota archaeon]|nr:PLP-dependent aminotransferase family protein [Candidatus Woesearchaeota archaeon]